MTKEKNNTKEFLKNKETLNIKEFMLLKSGEQDKLVEETLNNIYEGKVKLGKKDYDKVLNVAFDNKDNEVYLPHSLCVKKDGNKLVFSFRKKNQGMLLLFLLAFLFIAGFATFTGVQLIGKSMMNIDLNGDGVADLNLDLNDDGICEINCDTNKDKKPDQNIDYMGSRKPIFNILLEDGTISNKINQTNDKGVCTLNCDIDSDGWPDTNIDLDGDGKADINIDIDSNGTPDLNIDTNGDGVADVNIDEDNDGKCDRLCAYVADFKGGQVTLGGQEVTLETAALVVRFETGNDIKLSNLYPDDHKDNNLTTSVPDINFTVENTTDKELFYNLEWIEVENTFTSSNFWVKFTSNNGGYNKDWATAPTLSNRIVSNVVIPPKTTQEYSISFTLHGTGSEQNYDQGKTFKGKIMVELKESKD